MFYTVVYLGTQFPSLSLFSCLSTLCIGDGEKSELKNAKADTCTVRSMKFSRE